MIARRMHRGQSPATRAKISLAAKAQPVHAARGKRLLWPDVAIKRLRKAFRTGGLPAAYAAFPDRSEKSIYGAIRRYCMNLDLADATVVAAPRRKCWSDPEFVRRFDVVVGELLTREPSRRVPSVRRAVGMVGP